MRMKKILSCILVMVLLASTVPLAVTPAGAYEWKIPCDDGDNELTKAELVNAILPYMLEEEGVHTLDNVGDAAYIYAYWDGKPKMCTDTYGREITIYRPIERVIAGTGPILETLRSLKVPTDRIVGVDSVIQDFWGGQARTTSHKAFFPEYSNLSGVGTMWDPDVESMLKLHPDAVFLTFRSSCDPARAVLKSAGIPALGFSCSCTDVPEGTYSGEVEKLGYIFDKDKEAEEFIDWYENILNTISEGVEEIPDKTKVYFEAKKYTAYSKYAWVTVSGGEDIFDDAYGMVDPESIARLDPHVIIIKAPSASGYNVVDIAGMENAREELMSRDILKNVTAVKTDRVYVISGYISSYGFSQYGSRHFLQFVYMAKWFHPEHFEEVLDPKAIHQEYLTRFQGLDIDLDKQGVFVYHPTEHPDGN